MCEITISKKLITEIEELIKDDAIKRGYGYESVPDFIISAIENELEADKDAVGIPIH
jgi:hypothetical protein